MPMLTSDPILIPLMCRVASVIENLKTHLGSSETPANTAAAVARLEHALVTTPFISEIKLLTGYVAGTRRGKRY